MAKDKNVNVSADLSLGAYVDFMNKTYGDNTCVAGSALKGHSKRLPSGIFALDFATCGGFPLNQVACFKGPAAGGKSSVAMNVMAMASKLCWRCMLLESECTCSLPPLHMQAVWLDVEGTFDKDWAESIGVAPNSYFVVSAEEGEQYENIAKNLVKAPECGLVVLDSIAALVPAKISEGSGYDQHMGVEARMISRVIKKLSSTLARQGSGGHPCVVILINQVRFKIGELYGNPETMPGGEALKHLTSMWIRFNKVALLEKEKKSMKDDARKINTAQRHNFIIEKNKVSILAGGGTFLRCKEHIRDEETNQILYTKGQVVEYQAVLEAGKQYAVVTQGVGGKWSAPTISEDSGTQKELIEAWKKNPDIYHKVKQEIIQEGSKYILGDILV